MDELLRAYAQQRRQQAEPALVMHPATRKLLQDEVKRTCGATPAPTPSRPGWFSARWPLGALGGALAVLLLMFTVFHTPAPKPSPATTKNEGRRQKEEKSDMLTLNPAPATSRMERNLSEAKSAPGSGATLAAGNSATQPTPRDGRYGGAPHENTSAVASTAFASVSPAANDGSDVGAGEFIQVHDRALAGAAESPPSNVLSTFHFSRAGQNVRVVDADGSIYDGQVLGGIPVGGATEQFAKKPKDADQDANQNANYAFKVAGTNYNLRQNVVFTGNVLDMPVAAPGGHAAAQVQNRNASQVQNAQSNGLSQSAQNSRITGKVQVGGGKEFKIEAKPPPP